MIRSCSPLGIFNILEPRLIISLITFGLLSSCSDPIFFLDEDEAQIFRILKQQKKFTYSSNQGQKRNFVFNREIDTIILNNRSIANSFYDKTWSLTSSNDELTFSVTKSTLGPPSLSINFLNNKSLLDLDSLIINRKMYITRFQTHYEHPLEYVIIDINRGMLEYKLKSENQIFKLLHSE